MRHEMTREVTETSGRKIAAEWTGCQKNFAEASRRVSHQICVPQFCGTTRGEVLVVAFAAASKVHVINGVPTRGVEPFAVSARLVCAIVSAVLRPLESGTVPWQSANRIARRRVLSLTVTL